MNAYKDIVDFLTQDCITKHKDLAGIILLGSFSAKQGDDLSDIDVSFVYFAENYTPVQLPQNDWDWDVDERILTNCPGIPRDHWNGGAYVTAKILVDKTGEIAERIRTFVNPGFEYFKEGLANCLDGYYNGYYRSMKCLRRNNLLGAHVMACSSMDSLNTIFYQINGLLPTYLTRLPATIRTLNVLPLPASELLEHMTNIAVNADAQSQIRVYLAVKEMMNKLGYVDIHEAWDGKLDKEIELAQQR